MSIFDGSVLGMTQIFGSAPRNKAFNVVLLADGFTNAQQAAYNTACTNFVNAFTVTPPFNTLTPAINVFRVNVQSTDSGADDPVSAGGTGASVRTYFDSTFGTGGVRRLLTCNVATALSVAATQLPQFTVAIVVVNSTVYGGSGGSVGTFSLAGGANEIAIHEMGHTAFGLADEYPYYAGGAETGHDHHPAGEPGEPNVTVNTNRATLKWNWAVLATTALPTMSNPSCGTVDSRPSTVANGTVGLFEGAHYYHCGAYRPEYDCKMRNLGVPFCRICRQVILNKIGPFMPFRDWQEIDNNPATKAIVAAGNNLYQLHNNGRIWRYTGTPLTGWQLLDNNPATTTIVAGGNNLYQLHNNGRIWRYTGTPLTGWQLLDNNPATKAIIAADNNLYQLHNNGRIWKYTGTPLTGWQMLDNNPATVAIVAGGNNLYQLHNNGRIWRYTGPPLTGWQMIDNNPATKAIVAVDNVLYQLHNTGRIWKYTGVPLTGWQMLDNNPATSLIAAGGNNNLFQMHNNGKIWRYTGPPLTGWLQLDNNGASVAIVGAASNLYQLHNTGRIWRYTGPLF